ncbi:hypothetical protein BO83DRAFT_6992 [Aspergillus eucalypticola CBS 122712]|uniref:Uncharacterized protein n=1 Tax=Aspergillus eucalypticola (strain CBS 122712 / IBT 29274) TaxID=1448314 RepID=A0A317WH79_ASPEC|nr:uncharacterized protein BO83DRAFT_6992 [Aspergillus eucalypticola CBS 122712]PWY85385.1 hypothetical protein BO83DRAFT_6992 [Aspergillus eucalypticola CBS 122712]
MGGCSSKPSMLHLFLVYPHLANRTATKQLNNYHHPSFHSPSSLLSLQNQLLVFYLFTLVIRPRHTINNQSINQSIIWPSIGYANYFRLINLPPFISCLNHPAAVSFHLPCTYPPDFRQMALCMHHGLQSPRMVHSTPLNPTFPVLCFRYASRSGIRHHNN